MHTELTLWDIIRERWNTGGAGMPADDHLRRDIGLPPLPRATRIPTMVLAYAH